MVPLRHRLGRCCHHLELDRVHFTRVRHSLDLVARQVQQRWGQHRQLESTQVPILLLVLPPEEGGQVR